MNSINAGKQGGYRRSSILFCLVGPAGSGKTSLSKKLREASNGLKKIVSATTRAPRSGEIDGVNYYFFSKDHFRNLLDQGAFFESEEIHGNYYGQLNASIAEALKGEQDVVFDIDIRGAKSIKSRYPDRTVVVFLLPPSKQAIIDRMQSRSAITQDELDRRLKTAETEIQALFDSGDLVDHCLVNDNFDIAAQQLECIVGAERLRFSRAAKQDLIQIWK